MASIIEMKGLTKHFGAVRAVRGLELTVEQGEVFGYLGPNGAGKSTTIRMLLDFIRPTSGEARVFGLDAQRKGLEVRRRVGFLSGELSLYGSMTGAQLLCYAAHLRGMDRVEPAYTASLVERFDADTSVPLRTLSRGNRQKIGIVYAFMHKPDLLILDEPSSGLDPLMQQEFYRLLRETTAEGRTVFMSSHILPEVEQSADRVGIIRRGELVTVEDTAQLKHRSVRRIEVRFGSPPSEEAVGRIARVAGVSEVALADGVLRCRHEGAMDTVVKELATHEVVDLVTHEPGLEEVFLDFYEDKEPPDGHDAA